LKSVETPPLIPSYIPRTPFKGGIEGRIEVPILILRKTIQNLLKPQLLIFVVLMTGFTIIYMQFYETLPNFIYDWTDSSQLAKTLHLPTFMLSATSRGTMLSYEWFYNLNAGLIIIGVVFVAWAFSKKASLKVLSLGIIFASIGLFLCGLSSSGYLMFGGIIIYTFGEMTTNPRFADYMGKLAPENEKSLYMSYLNIPLALGLGGGSLLGGYLYKHFAEKANLALLYLNEHYNNLQNISLTNSMNILQKATRLDSTSATQLLWNTYQPFKIWIPFLVIGIISSLGLLVYSRNVNKK
jgi:MFS family permease